MNNDPVLEDFKIFFNLELDTHSHFSVVVNMTTQSEQIGGSSNWGYSICHHTII
jgi:hypothetical protein